MRCVLPAIALASLLSPANAQLLFSDTFDAGASPLWVNERSIWTASGGVYYSTAPSNSPPTLSSLPFTLGDFEVEVDIAQVSDGGVWLHIDNLAQNGVLLVTGGHLQTGTGLYWHTITNGSYSGFLNETGPLFSQHDNIHLRITAQGPTYTVYLNGGATPVASLTLAQPRTGHVGLYDFAPSPVQSYDNFRLSVPCYANCDLSTTPPILNVLDFGCFLNKFAAGDPAANCDLSTTPPVLNVLDFSCFLNRFAAGCT